MLACRRMTDKHIFEADKNRQAQKKNPSPNILFSYNSKYNNIKYAKQNKETRNTLEICMVNCGIYSTTTTAKKKEFNNKNLKK